jgi:hypothetical protein
MWMRGARFGVVEKIGRKWIHVRLDATDRVFRTTIHSIGKVIL